jgi:hypothetical protein
MVPLIALIAFTDSWVAAWMPDICWPISPVALEVCSASAFRRHDRKATAGFSGPRRLDGGVERQQVGLFGDGVDEFNHVADAAYGLRQFADAVVGAAGLADGVGRHPRRLLHLAADLGDR